MATSDIQRILNKHQLVYKEDKEKDEKIDKPKDDDVVVQKIEAPLVAREQLGMGNSKEEDEEEIALTMKEFGSVQRERAKNSKEEKKISIVKEDVVIVQWWR